MLWIPFAAIIMSLISLIQLAMYFYGMSRQLEKLQKQYDKRIKEQKRKKEKQDSEAKNAMEQKQIAQYKKTEIENRRFKLLQSGVDPVNINSTMEHIRSRKDSSVSAPTPPNAGTFVSNVDFTMTNEIEGVSEFKNEESSSSEDSDAPSEITDRDDLDEEQVERIRAKRANKIVTWDSIPIMDKLALYNKWNMMMAFGNLCTIFGSVYFIMSSFFYFH